MSEGRKTLPIAPRADLEQHAEGIAMTLRLKPQTCTLLATFVVLSGFVGCAGFGNRPEPTLNAEVMPASPATGDPAPQVDKYTVEIRSASGKAEALKQPLSGHICVQEALEQSAAATKFKRFDLELYRPLPGDRWHRMVLEYDRSNHRVPAETDYALQPGDRLIVIEDTSDIFDDVAQQVLSPLGLGPKTPKQKISERYRVGD
jgi:hypothetical protein